MNKKIIVRLENVANYSGNPDFTLENKIKRKF